jgi:hypothetical protein
VFARSVVGQLVGGVICSWEARADMVLLISQAQSYSPDNYKNIDVTPSQSSDCGQDRPTKKLCLKIRSKSLANVANYSCVLDPLLDMEHIRP